MCKTIAVCNQKGGVGKTTTTVNLGVGLAMQGKRVLLVDADPQADLTASLGWQDTDSLDITISDKLSDVIRDVNSEATSGILHHKENVDLLPSNLELSAFEMSLVTAMSRETAMRKYLDTVKLHYSPITGEWNMENKTYDRTNVKAYKTYGTDRINAYQIIEQTLNLKDVRIYDYK